MTLHAGGKSLVSFSFGVDSTDDLDCLQKNLKANGTPCERKHLIDRPGTSEVLSFDLPSGHCMELAVDSDGRIAGRTETKSDGTYRPTDIDHVNLLGEIDPKELSTFLVKVLEFKQSLALTIGGGWVAPGYAASGRTTT